MSAGCSVEGEQQSEHPGRVTLCSGNNLNLAEPTLEI